MAPGRFKKWFGGMVLTVALVLSCNSSWAALIEINDGTLSVEAIRTPLKELMRQLSLNYGITVRMDPDINPFITITFHNRELEDGLKAILKPHNHVFVWKNAPGKSGGTAGYELTEIHIFKPGQKDRMVTIPERPEESQPQDEPEPEPEPESGPESEPIPQTPVIIKQNRVFVPVTLGYGDNELETTLIFDTGAGSIVLHENIARQLGIEGREARGEGVGGVQIATRTSRLNYVEVGPYKKENLRVDIVAYNSEEDDEYNGLLGMNFIRGLKYTIDFDAQVIRWSP